jgi:hypothetical protein
MWRTRALRLQLLFTTYSAIGESEEDSQHVTTYKQERGVTGKVLNDVYIDGGPVQFVEMSTLGFCWNGVVEGVIFIKKKITRSFPN